MLLQWRRWVYETLASVLNQTYRNIELVVVNDGSTDATEEIIRAYDDSRIHDYSQPNRGLSASRNRTIELSRGELIAFVDQDDLVAPDKVEKQLDLFESEPAVGLVYSDSYLIKENGEQFGRYLEQYGGPATAFRNRILEPLLMYGNFVPLLSVMVRKKPSSRPEGLTRNTGWPRITTLG